MSLNSSENIFAQHLLQKQHLTAEYKTNSQEIWPSVFLLLCLGLLVIIKLRAYPRVLKVIQSAYSRQTLQQLEREESGQFKFSTVALNVFFVANLSFMIYKLNRAYGFVLSGSTHLAQFMLFTLLVSAMYGVRFTGNRALALISGDSKLIGDYEGSSALINQASGLFLFPWVVMAQFSKFNPLIFISGALITLAASVIIKWYRGIIAGLVEERIGLLQIFSYFCGLEILPVIVLVKYVIETF